MVDVFQRGGLIFESNSKFVKCHAWLRAALEISSLRDGWILVEQGKVASKQFSVQSIRVAALALQSWREANDSQGAMHLIHLLAAKYAGAKSGSPILYNERDVDYRFCDKFFRVNNSGQPYFDPLDMSHRIATHPHSNVATARKKTFSDKWKAGKFFNKDENEYFQLESDYISILVSNMSKKNRFVKISPAALACWLYREESFDLDSDINFVVNKFKSEFNFDDSEWNELFELSNDEFMIKLNQWAPERGEAEYKTIIEVMTHDIENFNMYNTLMALREVCNMPIVNPDQIKNTMESLGCNQVVLQGPPGTGKTHLAKRVVRGLIDEDLNSCRSNLSSEEDLGRWGILQFHPSYGYEDFIQRMVPKQDSTGGVEVKVVDMPFVVACKLALAIKPVPFVLVIDEMNRADLQKVFGELMYALEYRGESLTLQYSREPLVVPDNLYIVGTMNTADSSVVQVDYAIRRRFIFIDVPPDAQVIESSTHDEQTKKVALEIFRATNAACDNHPRFSIGHSYFLHDDIRGLINSFVYQVLPVLRSYQDNGVIPESGAVYLNGWDSEPITPWQHRPDVLVDALISWAEGL